MITNPQNCNSICSLLLPLALGMVLVGCGTSDGESGEVVAVVYGTELKRDELIGRLPAGYTPEDSARLADQIISAWVRDKALLKVAEDNLSESQKDVQAQLEEYRNSLITYSYERALVQQKLDTVISDQELQDYYDANAENFLLKRYIIKARFVKLAQDAPKQRDVEKWLQSGKEDDLDLLYDYSRKYAENFYFNSDSWLFVEELLKEVPIPASEIENYLKRDHMFKIEQEGFRYFVYMFDFRSKGDISPISLERQRIRDLILNRRKAELISKMREDVVKQGIAEGKIKLFTP